MREKPLSDLEQGSGGVPVVRDLPPPSYLFFCPNILKVLARIFLVSFIGKLNVSGISDDGHKKAMPKDSISRRPPSNIWLEI